MIFIFILISNQKVLKKVQKKEKIEKIGKKKKKIKNEQNQICLVSPSEAKSILLEKYNIIKEEKDIVI